MALYDDRRFLLSHINHSFITGDDTGICEVVMLDEEVFENQHQSCLKLQGQSNDPGTNLDQEAYDLKYESELFEAEQNHSYDIASELEYICHRRRSNTAQRLDKLRKEKIYQSMTTTIVWRCNPLTEGHMIEEERVNSDENGLQTDDGGASLNRRSKSPPSKSALTRLLEKYPELPKNPFDEFAKFDGGMSETIPVKKIMIFVAINQDQQKNNRPLEVVVVSTAYVQDLIGLICWQYTNEGREPRLRDDINCYCLRIAEDNGEVDPHFSSLNPTEPLSKFYFPSLALTEKTEERVRNYTTHYPNGNQVHKHHLPTITPKEVTGHTRFTLLAYLARLIFKDAKLDTNQQ